MRRRIARLLASLRVEAELVVLPTVRARRFSAAEGGRRARESSFYAALNARVRAESGRTAVCMLPLPPVPQLVTMCGPATAAAYVSKLRYVAAGLPPCLLCAPGEDSQIVTTEI